MSTIFTQVPADYARDQIFPALIKKIEVMGPDEVAGSEASFGSVNGCKLTAEPVNQNSAGGIPIQLGYKLAMEGEILATGTNMRTGVSAVIGNAHNVTLTDANGHKYTLLSDEFAIAIGESIEGDFEGARKFPVKGGGYLTKDRFNAVFTIS